MERADIVVIGGGPGGLAAAAGARAAGAGRVLVLERAPRTGASSTPSAPGPRRRAPGWRSAPA